MFDQVSNLAGCKTRSGRLTLEERAKLAVVNLQDHLEEKAGRLLETLGGYQPKVDWRNFHGHNYVTPVKNQGFCSACAAFGTLSIVEALVRITRKTDLAPPLSEGQLFFRTPGDQSCQSGWDVDSALDALKTIGVVPESVYPFDPGLDSSALPPGWQSMTTAITGATILKSHREMKRHLAEKGPLVSVLNLREDFLYYGSGIYQPALGMEMGGHCVGVVGYDDDQAAWIVKNSWGEAWGEGGFFRIAYGECGIDSHMWAVEGLSRVWLK